MVKLFSSVKQGIFHNKRLIFIISKISIFTIIVVLTLAIPVSAKYGILSLDSMSTTPIAVGEQHDLTMGQTTAPLNTYSFREMVRDHDWEPEPDYAVTVEMHSIAPAVPTEEGNDFGMNPAKEDNINAHQDSIGDPYLCDNFNDCILPAQSGPHFNVVASRDELWGGEWDPDSTVTVEVHDIPIIADTDSSGNFNTNHSENIVPGDTVTVTQGATSKSHVVTELAITFVDADADTVSGTAAAGSELNVWAPEVAGVWRHETAAGDGTWIADFSIPGDEPGEDGTTDLHWGSNADSSQCDPDDDCTFVEWTGPHFNVDTPHSVWGHNWEPESIMTVEVHGIATDETTDEGGNFDFYTGEDIVPGDTVTVTHGAVTKSHVVTELVVTLIDPDTDTVTGDAAPGSEVNIYVDAGGDNIWRRETVAPDGTWIADFSTPGDEPNEEGTTDLVPGSGGNSYQCDSDNDCTFVGWGIPNPQFWVDPFTDNAWGNEWTPNGQVTVTVNTTEVPGSPFGIDENGNFGTGLSVDLQANDEVVVTDVADPSISKGHTITSLTIDGVDDTTNTVWGTAAVGSDVWVDIHGEGNVGRTVTATDGTWLVDFDDPGDGGGTFDLEPGSNGYAFQCDIDNDCTNAEWWIPNPYFNVDASDNRVWGHDWEPDSIITVEVHGIATDETTDEGGNFDFYTGEDIVPGDTVTVTHGAVTKSHVVTELVVTLIDPDTDTVTGDAAPGSEVNIYVDAGGDNIWRRETVAPDGTWIADFSTPGDEEGEEDTLDLVPGSNGHAAQSDPDSDRTIAWFYIPNPLFQVYAASDHVSGNGWEPDSTVTVEVHGVPVDVPTDEVGDFGMDSGEDIVSGDTVTVTQGAVSKSHVVTELAITGVDPDADTVHGTAEPSSELYIWVHDTDLSRHETVAPDGTWSADFGTPGDEPYEEGTTDLVPGMDGNSNQCDSDDDCTNAEWQIPNPRFNVAALQHDIWGHDWEPDSMVTVEVNGIARDEPTDVDGYFRIGDFFGILPGDTVTVTQGVLTKSHVVTELAITGVDPDADTVFGTAAPGSELDIWVHDVDDVQRHEVVAPDGTWSADFGTPGDEPDEEGTTDLNWGSNGNSNQCDADNDCTFADWSGPHFNVDASHENVWGHEWEPNSMVTVEVHGIAIDVPTDEGGDFDMGADEDIIPGDIVTVTQGAVSKSHMVTELAITDVDPDTDTISGTAEPGSELDIWVHGSDAWRRETAAPDGSWSADFGTPGNESGEEDTTDLVPGSDGNSAQCDAENDCSFAGWYIPNPNFTVRLTESEVHGYGWPLGASVTVTIDDPGTPEDPDFEDTQTVVVSNWDPEQTFVAFNFYEILDVSEGFVVTMTDGVTIKEHIVTRLRVESVDVDTDIVSGIAVPYNEVSVAVCLDYIADCVDRNEIADEFGNWTADFSVPGDEGWEQDTFDIRPNTGGEAREHDEDDDWTQVSWWLTDPPTCESGNSVMGTVYESDGTTHISDATIYFEDFHSGEQLLQVASGDDGTYGCALPEGDYRIWATGGGYSRQYYDLTIYENADLVQVVSGIPISDVDFILDTPWSIYDQLTFNMSEPIVGELAVRQAIAFGTDRASIIAATFPSSPIWDTYLPPNHWAHATSGVPQYDFDPQFARDTLTAAGWVDEDSDGVREKNGERLHIAYVTTDSQLRADISQIFVENMADIGIEIEVFALPSPWGRIFDNHDFGIAQFAWGIDYNDENSGSSIWYVFESDNPNNAGFYSNPTADQLLADALAVPTRAEKQVYLEQHQALVMTDLAMLPLLERSVSATTIFGLEDQFFDQDRLPPGDPIDLWDYAMHPEAADDELTFTIEGTPPAGTGVEIVDNRWLHIDPSFDWCGFTDVTVRATDPVGVWDEDTFRVAVTWTCRGS